MSTAISRFLRTQRVSESISQHHFTAVTKLVNIKGSASSILFVEKYYFLLAGSMNVASEFTTFTKQVHCELYLPVTVVRLKAVALLTQDLLVSIGRCELLAWRVLHGEQLDKWYHDSRLATRYRCVLEPLAYTSWG